MHQVCSLLTLICNCSKSDFLEFLIIPTLNSNNLNCFVLFKEYHVGCACTNFWFQTRIPFSSINYFPDNFSANVDASKSKFKRVVFESYLN